ncbi:GTP-binding protein 1 (Fragment) [Durusdinium trenchii]|uniref:GTP-binding protein 1 n=1 Tax=Durusdinium trenchii TaxID=1381693 RepID=A0ABP0JPL4_9DINO
MKDVTVAVIGNVDSGKSTLVGVLTKGGLDDGRGLARAKVFNFSHEAANGRTSSIAQEIMGFNSGGDQVLIERMANTTANSRNTTWQQVMEKSERLVTFSDLCGHEKYLKTTIFGLVGQCPDYTMIIVNANAGFQRMSREHLGIALALRIPFFIVVTKIDIAPQNVYEENLMQLHKIVRSNAVKRQPLVVKEPEELEGAARGIYQKEVCPIFCISSVTGEGLPLLRNFLRCLPSRLQDSGLFRPPSSPAEFHIDSIYVVPGVGLVVGGVVRGGAQRLRTRELNWTFSRVRAEPLGVMLTIHKNRVVSDVTLQQASELDFYTNNYWIWGGTTVILAGFALAQLTREIPEGTHPVLEYSYLAFTTLCLSLDLCIVTWTVLVCTWGPGNALRGPDGMSSFHDTVTLLKDEQMSIYYAFVVSIVAYFGSSCCLLWVYPSGYVTNTVGTAVLLLSLMILLRFLLRLEQQVGTVGNSHDDDGRIQNLRPFEHVGDLDERAAAE